MILPDKDCMVAVRGPKEGPWIPGYFVLEDESFIAAGIGFALESTQIREWQPLYTQAEMAKAVATVSEESYKEGWDSGFLQGSRELPADMDKDGVSQCQKRADFEQSHAKAVEEAYREGHADAVAYPVNCNADYDWNASHAKTVAEGVTP
jgi:flagellar biosynthesis/type III secretory pathway protein FliH